MQLQTLATYGNYKDMLRISYSTSDHRRRSPRRSVTAFSMLELLAAVCLLGIVNSLAVCWYASAEKSIFERLSNQRNAQEIVSLSVSATVAGASFVVPESKQGTIENLMAGTMGKTGVWKGKSFRLSGLHPDSLPGALPFVKFEAKLLLYEPGGGQL